MKCDYCDDDAWEYYQEISGETDNSCLMCTFDDLLANEGESFLTEEQNLLIEKINKKLKETEHNLK